MMKYILVLIPLFFSGCYFTFNASMCDQISSEPNAVMSQECRDYNEAEASKAFHKKKNETSVNDDDLEFKQED